MPFDPSQCRVLSVGKAIAQLEPFLAQHGYKCVGKESGLQAIEVLSEQSFHIVLMELNLRDIELRDFYEEAIKTQKDAAFLIMAPPNLAEDIVSALVAGADGYIAVPPDEDEMFRELARQGAAAIARKEANPEGDPGVQRELDELKERATKYRGHAENLQKQVVELREAKEKAESDASDLRKELKKAGGASDGPKVPPGHRVVKDEEYEELESRATFIEFLESENDELKKEIEQLKQAGGGEVDDFDESTGAMSAPPAGMLAGGSDEEEGILIEDDDGDELVLLDDDDGEEIAAAAESVKSPAPAPAPAPVAATPAPAPAPEPEPAADDFEENTDALLALVEDSSEEELVLDEPAPKPAAQAAPPPVITPAPPPVVSPAPKPVAAPAAEADDEFENLNTDALLALTDDSDDDEIDDDELQALLDDID